MEVFTGRHWGGYLIVVPLTYGCLELEMKETIIGLVSAGIGFISGLLVPWIKWEIEKRQKKFEYRKGLIASWKAKLAAAEFNSQEGRSGFGSSHEYSSLRLHMAKDVIKKFEAPRTIYVGGGRGDDVRKQMLLDEVARLEKQWGMS